MMNPMLYSGWHRGGTSGGVEPRRDQPGGSSGCSTRRLTALILAPQAIHRAIIRPHDQTAATHGRRARNRTPQGELRQLGTLRQIEHIEIAIERSHEDPLADDHRG